MTSLHTPMAFVETGASAGSAKKAVLLVHGRGATAESMLPVAQQLLDGKTRIIMPQAAGNAWYPFPFMSPFEANEPYLTSALHVMNHWLAGLTRKYGAENVGLAGFSQGACLALEAAVRFEQRLGAVGGFSGGLIGPIGTTWKPEPVFENTPVFLGCHQVDPHIPLSRVQESAEVFKRKGAQVALKIYPENGHHVMPGQVEWLQNALNGKG